MASLYRVAVGVFHAETGVVEYAQYRSPDHYARFAATGLELESARPRVAYRNTKRRIRRCSVPHTRVTSSSGT